MKITPLLLSLTMFAFAPPINAVDETAIEESPTSISRIEVGWGEPQTFEYYFEKHLPVYAQKKYAVLFAMLESQLSATQAACLDGILKERELMVNNRNSSRDEDYLVENRMKYDRQIRAELGDNIADAVITFLENAPTRAFISHINMVLLYREDPLAPGQVDALCRIFSKYPSYAVLRGIHSDEMIQKFLEKRRARDEAIRAEAEKYLSNVQLEVLSKEMQFQLSYTHLGIARAVSLPVSTGKKNK